MNGCDVDRSLGIMDFYSCFEGIAWHHKYQIQIQHKSFKETASVHINYWVTGIKRKVYWNDENCDGMASAVQGPHLFYSRGTDL